MGYNSKCILIQLKKQTFVLRQGPANKIFYETLDTFKVRKTIKCPISSSWPNGVQELLELQDIAASKEKEILYNI